ncbi:hypothetical protein NTD86_17910 [Pseudomonas sp. 7P_10.2_Bac1]|uniref:hypothetical protein n=1 Tax=Pseudomonas sp. 7P_10.2_Bac1 TaxID=2971614 RepID=UPI0021C8380C|nr:hypothetical protein [Pseudomonas sp. 7P_10.2_Bac1]MCU1728863.1 hypothetical protein [Pseudomonas sp. 7P_10.2_Bac1]
MDAKLQFVQFAGISVMFPAALVIAAWLWAAASKKIACLWLGVLLCAYFIVGVTKILFKGWGIGFHGLDIAVFSGHATNSCLVFTVMLSLLCQQIHPRLRWPAFGIGVVLTWWFSINYIGHTIHPLAEAIAGALVGTISAGVFLMLLSHHPIGKIPRPALAMGLVVVLVCSLSPKYSAEKLLDHIAISLSGAEQAFRRSS